MMKTSMLVLVILATFPSAVCADWKSLSEEADRRAARYAETYYCMAIDFPDAKRQERKDALLYEAQRDLGEIIDAMKKELGVSWNKPRDPQESPAGVEADRYIFILDGYYKRDAELRHDHGAAERMCLDLLD